MVDVCIVRHSKHRLGIVSELKPSNYITVWLWTQKIRNVDYVDCRLWKYLISLWQYLTIPGLLSSPMVAGSKFSSFISAGLDNHDDNLLWLQWPWWVILPWQIWVPGKLGPGAHFTWNQNMTLEAGARSALGWTQLEVDLPRIWISGEGGFRFRWKTTT